MRKVLATIFFVAAVCLQASAVTLPTVGVGEGSYYYSTSEYDYSGGAIGTPTLRSYEGALGAFDPTDYYNGPGAAELLQTLGISDIGEYTRDWLNSIGVTSQGYASDLLNNDGFVDVYDYINVDFPDNIYNSDCIDKLYGTGLSEDEIVVACYNFYVDVTNYAFAWVSGTGGNLETSASAISSALGDLDPLHTWRSVPLSTDVTLMMILIGSYLAVVAVRRVRKEKQAIA